MFSFSRRRLPAVFATAIATARFTRPWVLRRVRQVATGAAVGSIVFCAGSVVCQAPQKVKGQSPFDAKKLREDIEAVLAQDYSYGPLFVRLAWHEAASWHQGKKDGAPNTASMRFAPECSYGGNNGLAKARSLLDTVKAKHPQISYADLWAFAANVAISAMGGPEIPFRYGRQDAKDGSVCAEARLPDAAQTQDHVRDTFTARLGFSDKETVALIGAHTIGECHAATSGFVGPWTHDRYGFDNSFFTELLESDWIVDTRYSKLQFTDSKTRRLMMLPSDVALIIDPKYRKYVELYAKDQELWWKDFSDAFQKLLELGNHKLSALAQ